MKALPAAATLFLASVSPAQAGSLYLVCVGEGSATKQDTRSAFVTENYGNSGWGQAYGTRDVAFADQVNIEIVDGAGKIRMPRSMLPPIRGGKDGWMELENLKESDREITANAAVNVINSPKVRIDRYTGMLSISGKSGNFTAQCRKIDPAATQRAF